MSVAGYFSWAVKDSMTAALLASSFFYEGLLNILALGFLSVSILRSNKVVAELPNRKDVVKDIQQFTIFLGLTGRRTFWQSRSLVTVAPKSLWTLAWIIDITPNLVIFSSSAILVPLFQCTKKRMARKIYCLFPCFHLKLCFWFVLILEVLKRKLIS